MMAAPNGEYLFDLSQHQLGHVPLRRVDHKGFAVPGDLVYAVALLLADINFRSSQMRGAYCCMRVCFREIEFFVARHHGRSFC